MPGLVTRRRRRRLSAIVSLALGLLMLSSTAAQASSEFSDAGLVFGCNGGICFNFHDYAHWSAVQGHSEGTHYWAITNLNPYTAANGVKNAVNTAGLNLQFGITVQALNAAGAVVTNISLTPNSACGQTQAWDGTGVHFQSCRSYAEVPLSVTKLRFRIKVVDPNKLGVGWDKTWTAPIV